MDSTRPSPPLPDDIVIAILVEATLEYLADGQQNKAAALCLVSPSALSTLQITLCRHPVILFEEGEDGYGPNDDFDGYFHVNPPPASGSYSNIDSFYTTLRHYPRLAQHVMGVSIVLSECSTQAPPQGTFGRLNDACPHLETVGIHDSNYEHSHPVVRDLFYLVSPTSPFLVKRAPKLRHFVGEGMNPQHEGDLERLLLELPDITSLSIDGDGMLPDEWRAERKLPTFALHHLNLLTSTSTSSWLNTLTQNSKTTLRSLHFVYGAPSSGIDLSTFTSLTSLDVTLLLTTGQATTFVETLVTCKTLQRLTIGSYYVEEGVDQLTNSQCLSKIPTSVTSLNILRLPFSFEAFQTLFDNPRINLRRLYWRRNHLNDEDRDAIEQECEDRGIELYSEVAKHADTVKD